jgi:hypothetical protein
MLVEVKVKVARIIDAKTRKRTETFIVPDCELFVNAEHAVMSSLTSDGNTVEDYQIQSLKLSQIKEIADQFSGEHNYIATLKDIFHEDDGTEKAMKYKVLLWADNLTQANANVEQMTREGYDMQIEGIKQVDYEYLAGLDSSEEEAENE